MNIYQLLRDLANSGNRNEQWLREVNEYIDTAQRLSMFGTVGGQELSAHECNFQWDFHAHVRSCTVCRIPSSDQRPPYSDYRRRW